MAAPMRNIWKIAGNTCAKVLAVGTLVLSSVLPAAAQTESRGGYGITSFDVDVAVQADASLDVTETIRGQFFEPRHGIFRKIPVRYETEEGRSLAIPLRMRAITLGGKPVPFDEYGEGNDRVFKIGDPNVEIVGPFTYTLRYTVRRVMLYEQETDQVYWNVTGNGWDVPIPASSAHITVPGVAAQDLSAVCYTGVFGSDAHDCAVEISDGAIAVTGGDFLTVAVRFPKGVVAPPSAADQTADWWARTWPKLTWLMPLAAFVLLYRYWQRHGKDAKGRGTIIAEYDPPAGVRPTEAGALLDTKVHVRDLSAIFIDLAVRGYLKIVEKEETTFGVFKTKNYTLVKQKEGTGLKPYEKEIYDALFSGGDEKTLTSVDSGMASAIHSAGEKVYESMATDGYFRKNPKSTTYAFFGIAAVVGVAGWMAGLPLSIAGESLQPLAAFMATALVFLCFAPFMKAYTEKGAQAKEHVLGFKEFLTTAERYRLQWQEREGIFEKFLPYAVAFGVTEKWAKAFEGMNLPQPTWYVGAYPGVFIPTDFARSVSNFGAVASTVQAPSAKSGGGFGGSGFSGGGFGGGGGGSW